MEKRFRDCFVRLDGASLVIGNDGISRSWRTSPGSFSTVSLDNSVGQIALGTANETSWDFSFDGLTARRTQKGLRFRPLEIAQVRSMGRRVPSVGPQRLSTCLTFRDEHQDLTVRWWARVLAEFPAISIQCEIRCENAPLGDFNRADFENVLDSVPLASGAKQLVSVLFRARTDGCNELVELSSHSLEDLGGKTRLETLGNILLVFCENGDGYFLLHDGPCREDRRLETKQDFLLDGGRVRSFGWGIRPEEISSKRFLRSYTVTTGLFSGGPEGAQIAVKRFLKKRYCHLHNDRPVMIANPWGDRRWLKDANSEFVKKELEACSEIGLTHYQLDDGWQAGGNLQYLSSNGVVTDAYWETDREKYPGGFQELWQYAKSCGVKLGLWYAADSNRDYRDWRNDVNRLVELRERGHFDRFKIDMMRTRTKQAEDNVLRVLEGVRRGCGNRVKLDLDLTGRIQRPGYFLLQDHGDIFVENRYTAWGNYFPWKTARNFWMLSRYLPLQRLEMEFLNPGLNKQSYEKGDPLAPAKYDIRYLFAMTFFAIPLCWCEPSVLTDADRKRLMPLVDLRRHFHVRIQNSLVIPIGREPNGRNWFGFLAAEDASSTAILSIFRDQSAPESRTIDLSPFKTVSKSGRHLAGKVDISCKNSKIVARAKTPGSFGLFEVELA